MKKNLLWLLIILFLTACGQPLKTNETPTVETSNVETPSTKNPEFVFETNPIILEYGSQDHDPKAWVKSGEWDALDVSEIDTKKLGKQDVIYRFTVNQEVFEKTLTITIEDTQNPVFTKTVDTMNVKAGQALDLTAFQASDPVDGDLKISYEKDSFDENSIGEQKVVVIATDNNGNQTKHTILVTVEKVPVIKVENETKTEPVNFKTVRKEDSTLDKGKEVVTTKGVNGTRTITYKVTYTDGKETERIVLSSKVTKEPIHQVISVGTKVVSNKPKPPVDNKPVNPKIKYVAFTFDDGPYGPVDQRLMRAFEKVNGRATFFVVGNRVLSNADVLKSLDAKGHQIANHSYNHPNLTKLSPKQIQDQINKTNQVVYQVIGKYPEIIRPTYGAVNKTVLNSTNLPLINWNVDSLDWKSRNASKIIAKVKNNISDGSIVLFHDLYPSTASAIESLLPDLYKQGYRFVTVKELFKIRGASLQPHRLYFSVYSSR